MKKLCNLWKTGVVLLLCFSMLSVSVLAHDEHTDAEEHADAGEHHEEVFETGVLPEEEHNEAELTAFVDETEKLPVVDDAYQELPEADYETASDTSDEAMSAENTVTEEAYGEKTVKENTEPAIGTVVKSGDCGYVMGTMFYTITYVGDGHYKLTISGTGMMLLITVPYGAPWNKYAEKITEVEIKDGVEGIREYAFNYFSQVTSLTIPASVNYIEKGSFKMSGLQNVYFLGDYYNEFNAKAFSGTSGVIVHHKKDLNWGDFTFEGTTSQESDVSLQKIDAKEPGCTTEGHAEYYYSASWDKYFSDAEAKQEIKDIGEYKIPALGHDWDEGKVTQEPTATEKGVITYTCNRCEDTRYDSIPAISDNTIPDEPATPGDGVQEPDLKDDATLDKVDVNVNVNYQNRPGTGQTAGEPAQTINTSAGQVKTADENPHVLYLVLLALCGIALIAILRKQILK